MAGTISDELVDENRYINVDFDDWWDSEIDYWTERLERMGLTDVKINFTGFCSQGDGASFTGSIYSHNMRKFMRIHGLRDKYRAIYEMAKDDNVWGRVVRTSHHYCHEHTVTFEADMNINYWDDDSNDLRDIMLCQFWQQAERDLGDFSEVVQEILRGYMRRIYDDLEKEYDYLTSDEAVRETLEANEIYDDELLEAA